MPPPTSRPIVLAADLTTFGPPRPWVDTDLPLCIDTQPALCVVRYSCYGAFGTGNSRVAR